MVLPADHLESRRDSNEINKEIENEISGANQKTILERVIRKISKLIRAIHALLNQFIVRKILLDGSLHLEGSIAEELCWERRRPRLLHACYGPRFRGQARTPAPPARRRRPAPNKS